MTQEYYGSKQITAWEQDKDGQPGYAVKYSDGNISWSPKEVFEASYLPLGHILHLEPYQQRLICERVQLCDRLSKLTQFMQTEQFAGLPEEARKTRIVQRTAMQTYLGCLENLTESFYP